MEDTIHNRIIARARRDGWQRGPWKPVFLKKCREREAWREEIEAETDDDGICELFDGFRSVPDAWRLVAEDETTQNGSLWCHPVLVLEFLEVEITHPMPLHKRDEYTKLWWAMDGTDSFHLRVYRAERYGPIELWLDTETIYYDMAQPIALD